MIVFELTVCTMGVLSMLNEVTGIKRIVIDTDPGVDDILALLVALGDPTVEIIAITCLRGNTDIYNIVKNTLYTLHVAGKQQIPVYVGASQGLVESPPSDYYYGINGTAGVSFPNLLSVTKVEDEPAAVYLANIVKRFPGEITILTLGPLTNIALAIHLNPDFLRQARDIVIVGGSVRGQGNTAPGVEFNMYIDAAAASFVFDQALASSRLLGLVPLETVIDHRLDWDWRWKVLGRISNRAVGFMNLLDSEQQRRYPREKYTPADVHATVIALAKGYVTSTQKFYATVEYRGDKSLGAVFVDYTNFTGNAANVDIITNTSAAVLKKKIYDNFLNFY